MLKINELLWYERLDESSPYWFVNTVTYEIENIEKIIPQLDISEEYFITFCYDYDYLAFPVVDSNKIAKDFLVIFNNRKVSEYFNRLDDKDFSSEFGRIFHYGPAHDWWISYFYERKKEIFIKWCKENRIPYML